MDIKRRTFIQAASVSAAGLIVPEVFGHSLANRALDKTPGLKPSTLDLKIWGSCLYVFTKDRKRLELAFFGAGTASSCHMLAHQPQLLIGNGQVKDVDGDLEVDKSSGLWSLPPGEITIAAASQGKQPPALSAALKEGATPCPPKPDASKDFYYPLQDLAYVPRLRAKNGGSMKGWRKRATTRIVLTSGTLTAAAPHMRPEDIAEMELVGGGQTTTQVVTDTTRYSAPLADRTVTFSWSNDKGKKGSVTYEAIGDTPLRLVIQAGPESTATDEELKVGDSLPHWCALYSVFDKMPEDRANLVVKRFCLRDTERVAVRSARAEVMSRSARADERDAIKARALRGPTPGDLCPGAIIVLDDDAA